jgi:hypothetical protein
MSPTKKASALNIGPASVQAVTSESFVVAARTGLTAAEFGTWDIGLARPPRVLVPIDVQALVVTPAASVTAVPVLPQLADPDASATGSITDAMPPVPPFSPATPRAPGVYLHWAAPDGLTSTATHTPRPAAPGDDVGAAMKPLADRWLVVRIGGGIPRRKRAWVIEAERARRVDLSSWKPTASPPDDGTSRTPHLAPERLTAVAGGDPSWAAVYDAVEDRFAMHDDLSDLDPADATGSIAYLVCGWWSNDVNDPLYVPDQLTFVETMAKLRWDHPVVAPAVTAERDIDVMKAASIGLASRVVAPAVSIDTAGESTPVARSFVPNLIGEAAGDVLVGHPADHPQLSLLHGCVIGVRPDGAGTDPIPDPAQVEVAVGASATEAFAAIVTAEIADAAQREADERLVEAFSQGLISRLDSPDGLAALDEAMHAARFKVLPGDSVRTDHLLTGDRLATGAAVVEGRLAGLQQASAQAATDTLAKSIAVQDAERFGGLLTARSFHQVMQAHADKLAAFHTATQPDPDQVRAIPVSVASEPFADALDPIVTLRGLNRSLRHGYDGRNSPDGTLACRVSGTEVTQIAGLVRGLDVVAPLGNGALPPECDSLLQELVIDNPYWVNDVASVAATRTGIAISAVANRLVAEHALRYDTVTSESGKDLLRAASLRDGTDASPIATTDWQQPWVPLFLEWTLGLRVDQQLDGWTLAPTDLVPNDGTTADPGTNGTTLQYSGRALLTSVAARTFASQVLAFVNDEDARGPAGAVLQPAEEDALASVAAAGFTLDLLSGALAELHPQLLGLAWADASRSHRHADGTPILPAPIAPPVLLPAGVAWFDALRVVDAFGRTIDIPPGAVVAASSLKPATVTPPPAPTPAPGPAPGPAPAPGADLPAAQLLLRPRITRPSRTLLDFVDAAAADGAEPAPAMVDQSGAGSTVSPVCGWLLPDHYDGALEVFDAAAQPLGMLLEDIRNRVVWEGAPGRPGPAGAPPSALSPSDTAARHVVRLAAALVAADAARRADPVTPPDEESALAALLRVVDTTAWTVDPLGSLGTEHPSALLGRPIAVLRMQVQIQVDDDLATDASAELALDPASLATRTAAYDALTTRRITVRLGELTRTDDGVLGYFVDDDYSRFTPVSSEVLAQARASGRLVGQLGVLGPDVAAPPAITPITHPYVDDSETPLQVRPGQTVRLTVLMAPGGTAHATAGLVPRVATPLSREWIAEPLKKLMPTFRVGPVLVDPTAVRVPKTTGLPKQQVFTARPDPASWRDDPISAATQDALLPTEAAVVREGYLRITLPDPAAPAPASP